MSFAEIDRTIELHDSDVFLHSSILRPEIEKFRDNFERNERHKEFDGLIRRNHRIYEANDAFPKIKDGSFEKLLDTLKRVETRMKMLRDVNFSKNDLRKVDLLGLTQMDILKLAEAKIQESMPVDRLDVIRETSAEDRD